MDSNYLTALEKNIATYLRHRKITVYHWINPRVIILVQLFEAHPEPLPQSSFIDELHDRQVISRAVNDLVDNGFLVVERLKSSGMGAPLKYLHLSDSGKQFVEYIDPDQQETNNGI